MNGGYNYAYDKVAMPKVAIKKCQVEFYSTKITGCDCCSFHQMLGRNHPSGGF
jgi:hypothetical protein